MKKICLAVAFITCFHCAFSQKKFFVRIYSANQSKIGKGQLVGTTDSSVLLLKEEKTYEIKYTDIGFIKSKRSIGHSVLTSAVIGAALTTGIGLATNGSSTPRNTGGISSSGTFNWSFNIHFNASDIIVAGVIIGGITGAGIGAILGTLKRSEMFIVNGHPDDWRKVRSELDRMLGVYRFRPDGQ